MPLILNNEQEHIVQEAVDWYFNSSEQIFQISGKPGTGKTTVLDTIIKRLNLRRERILPMAYVGCAALNMRLKGLLNARTIHSALYETVESLAVDKLGQVKMNDYFNRPETSMTFVPKELVGQYDLFIISEGGMVPLYMKPIIERYGIKVLVEGDLNQLPPVADSPAYLYTGQVHVLNTIMRQAITSAIPYLAERALNGLPIHTGFYYPDVLVINEEDLTDQMILSADMIITGKNDTRDKMNNRIRHDIFRYNSDLPYRGERIMCAKNNWCLESDGINLVNGLTGTVMNNPDVSRFDGKSFRVDFIPDYGTQPFFDIPVDYEYFNATHEQRKILKNSKYYNGEKFEFSYANTCHKCQGASIGKVIYIEEYLNRDIQCNLNYTGITRAKYGLIYVKKKRKYY